MVEISSLGFGEGQGGATGPGHSTRIDRRSMSARYFTEGLRTEINVRGS